MSSGFQNCINHFSRCSQCGEHLEEHIIFIYLYISFISLYTRAKACSLLLLKLSKIFQKQDKICKIATSHFIIVEKSKNLKKEMKEKTQTVVSPKHFVHKQQENFSWSKKKNRQIVSLFGESFQKVFHSSTTWAKTRSQHRMKLCKFRKCRNLLRL